MEKKVPTNHYHSIIFMAVKIYKIICNTHYLFYLNKLKQYAVIRHYVVHLYAQNKCQHNITKNDFK